MTLREEIAQRLYAYYLDQFDPNWQPKGILNNKACAVLADEVIRLMEWARQRCACDRNDYVGSPDMPLALPPEDWKP